MTGERTPVSYRDLSPRTIREKRYSHLFLLLGWVGYFLLYTLTENLIPPEKCHVIHCALDDAIPFCEGFLIFYVSWYVLIVLSLLYFLRWDVDSFKKLQIFIMITQAVAMLIYILWPSRQDLRPEVFPRQNFLTWVMGIIFIPADRFSITSCRPCRILSASGLSAFSTYSRFAAPEEDTMASRSLISATWPSVRKRESV